jgi:type IV pilus assembly protein PilA
MKKIIKSSKGFTLIELIVVIAILLIIMAIAVPAYISHRDSARVAAHESNIKILQDAATVFVLENPSVSTIWAPFEGQEADPELEITETNQHDSWNRYVANRWPVNPLKTGAYVVEITEAGKITVSPQGGAE